MKLGMVKLAALSVLRSPTASTGFHLPSSTFVPNAPPGIWLSRVFSLNVVSSNLFAPYKASLLLALWFMHLSRYTRMVSVFSLWNQSLLPRALV